MPLSLSSARVSSALFAAQLILTLACGAALAQSKTGQLVPQVPGIISSKRGAQTALCTIQSTPSSTDNALCARGRRLPLRRVPYGRFHIFPAPSLSSRHLIRILWLGAIRSVAARRS